MVRRRAFGLALLGGAAAGSMALGYAAKRRAMGEQRPVDDPEWDVLLQPLHGGRDVAVTSFDGTRLHAQVHGNPDASTIVLVHGYGLGSRFWLYQVRDLADEFRLVVYDQRGHGRSDRASRRGWRGGDYTIEALGHDLGAVLDATVAPGERVLVVGHSMGGMSILAFAQEHPRGVTARLAGAALLNTGASRLLAGSLFSTGIAALGAVEEAVTARLGGRGDPEAADIAFLITRAVGLSPEASSGQVAFVEQLLIDMPREAKAAFAQTLGNLDLSEAVAHLTVPTLVLAGGRDRLTPPRHSELLVDELPGAELVVLPRSGHHAPVEDHAAVTDHLRRLARRLLPRAGEAV